MIELININKKFGDKVVLENFSLKVNENEFVTIVGKSGSGKTTILNMIGLLENPDSGVVRLNNFENPSNKEIKKIRRNILGYIFQNYALMENETVKTNLELAKKYNKNYKKSDLTKVLNDVGLDPNIMNEKIYNLSGGEQQRVSIARILLKPCDIILADEPTGNLDDFNKKVIIDLLKKMKELGKTIVCVTHDKFVAENSDRSISID